MKLQRYDPAAMRREIDGERRYIIDAVGPYPLASVTSVIAGAPTRSEDYALANWSRSMNAIEPGFADVCRDVAADRGTEVHAITTRHLEERTAPAADDPSPWMRSLAPLIRQWNTLGRLVLSDSCVWHGYDMVAGTLDLLLLIAGKWLLVDLKSATEPREPEQLRRGVAQLGGYTDCIAWTHEIEVDHCALAIALPDRPAQVRMYSPDEARGEWHRRLAQYRLHESPRGVMDNGA